MIVRPKKKVIFLISLITILITIFSVSLMKSDMLSFPLSLFWLIFPSCFIFIWKELCIDSKIEIKDNVLYIFSARVSLGGPVSPVINFNNYRIPVSEIKSICLERDNNSGVFYRWVGKGEPFFSITNLRGETIKLTVQMFNFEKVRIFFMTNFTNAFVVKE